MSRALIRSPWLGRWLVIALLLGLSARIAMRLLAPAPPPLTGTQLPADALPPLPTASWHLPASAPVDAPAAARLPLSIVGTLRGREESDTILVMETPEGQRVVTLGEPIMDDVHLHALTSEGAVVRHAERQEQIPWPTGPLPGPGVITLTTAPSCCPADAP